MQIPGNSGKMLKKPWTVVDPRPFPDIHTKHQKYQIPAGKTFFFGRAKGKGKTKKPVFSYFNTQAS